MITFLGILGITGGKSKIGHHVLKVVDDKIGPIIWQMYYKSINKNTDYELPLKFEHNVELWENLIEYTIIKHKFIFKEGISKSIKYK